VRGKTLFAGYFDAEAGSVILPLDAQGWFRTGDVGKWENGKLTILGRKDNMFISGGENIQPEEIELLLSAIPGVEQAVVVGVSSEEYGARPVAFVSSESGFSEANMREILASRLPKYKIPERFFAWPESATLGLKPNRPFFAKEGERLCRARS
jgi:O-succinylbenzoic acid--CoA ligase